MLPISNPPPRTRFIAFVLHTFAVYFIALRVSPWMVGRWFAWVMPVLHLSTSTTPADWYLQHLEMVTVVFALIAGYITVRQSFTLAPWAWCVPSVILIYKMLQFHNAHHSALVGTTMSGFGYFFELQRVMPTFSNLTATDPSRVLAQMTVTAPFYAGVAYSMGALVAKYRLLERLFGSNYLQTKQNTAASATATDE